MTIRTAFLIALCNMASSRASKVLVTLFAIKLGGNPLTIGVLVALYSVFPMLLALYAGRLSDRMGARPPTIFGSAGVAAGLVVPFIMPSLAGLYISAMLIGTGYVFLNVSIQNLIGVASESGERTKNFSNYSLVLATGGFLGPLAAGFGIDALGYTRAYLCLAAAPLLALALALASGRQAAVAAGAAHEAQEAQAKKAADLWRIPGLKRVFVTSAMVLTGIDLYQFYLPIYGHSIGLSASLIGVVLSTFAAAAFVVRSAVPLLTRLAGEDALLRYALYVGALAYLFMPFLANPWLLALMSFVLGLGLGAGQPLSMMLTYARSPAGRSGEALGLRMSVNNFTHVAVPLAFGTLGAAFGVSPVFFANAALLAGGAIFDQTRNKR
jgi:MFS family permease